MLMITDILELAHTVRRPYVPHLAHTVRRPYVPHLAHTVGCPYARSRCGARDDQRVSFTLSLLSLSLSLAVVSQVLLSPVDGWT